VADSLRLDKFLWFARIVKTRALAQALAEQGRIRIGGRLIDRAHAPVRVGDVLSFAQRGSVRVLKVEALPARRGPPAEARALYVEIAEGGSETPLPPFAGEEGPAREAGGK
jgi:ribosome-associated heat shock protein Hsp15